ncbi:peptidylprolyl isomerase [Novosphingobium sp. FSW06-99]|uniref:peptidylprolyl isomerase n=1 Tax=Novosphingobium sp. FSW06-99 TaxID=1739113 RepID=UPI00076C0056|nr:peptidylprolyl isomerase [Novosphingobium sp. FSW06-99]KUR76341.1 peptidylprolyl isomerase [Novosphingobium sp. FSW06-99]
MTSAFRRLHVSTPVPLRLALMLGLVLAGVPGPITAPAVHAQEDVPAAPPPPPPASTDADGNLNLPNNPQFYGKMDPNHRHATAIVNGEIITGTDIDQRFALFANANTGKISPEELERLRAQVVRNLIDETLEIQEAKAADITIDDDEVNQRFAYAAQQNMGKDAAALEAYLTQIGSSAASLKRQIRGEIAWQRLLRRNVQPYINVSDSEVREIMDRLKASKGTEEYHLGEIYLAANDENRTQVLANADKIVEQLKKGGNFVGYARQYSQASTAAVGGDLGWIRLAQLPSAIAGTAAGMGPGQLAGPLEVSGGYSIIYVIDKRQVLTADPRDAILSLKQISISFKPGTPEREAAASASAFAKAIKDIHGCGQVDAAAARIGATVVGNDQIKARDLPVALQQSVLKLAVGEATPPFGSVEDGVRVLLLCGRDDPKVNNGPSFEQLQEQLEDDRVNKRAQTYLRDLRRDAVIEYN